MIIALSGLGGNVITGNPADIEVLEWCGPFTRVCTANGSKLVRESPSQIAARIERERIRLGERASDHHYDYQVHDRREPERQQHAVGKGAVSRKPL